MDQSGATCQVKREKEWSVCGPSAITDGRLDLGPWEQIYYGEFDGRRRKRVLAKIIGE